MKKDEDFEDKIKVKLVREEREQAVSTCLIIKQVELGKTTYNLYNTKVNYFTEITGCPLYSFCRTSSLLVINSKKDVPKFTFYSIVSV